MGFFEPDRFQNRDDESQPQESFATLSNWVSQNSIIGLTNTYYSETLPGELIDRFHKKKLFLNYVEHIVKLSSTVFESTKRGILYQRGYLDVDEIDLGWLSQRANMEIQSNSNIENLIYGETFLLIPLATSSGFEISGRSSISDDISYKTIESGVNEIITNSSPEDTVYILELLFGTPNSAFKLKGLVEVTFPETVEHILDSAINLLDFYKLFANQNTLFKVISEGYSKVFENGLTNFWKVYEETKRVSLAVTQSFIALCSVLTDSSIESIHGFDNAKKVQVKAKNYLKRGGVLSDDQDFFTYELKPVFSEFVPRLILPLTSSVSFLAYLSNIHPSTS